MSASHISPVWMPSLNHTPTDRPWKNTPNAEFGIAVGSSPHNNGSTLVFILGKVTKPRERADVILLKVPSPAAKQTPISPTLGSSARNNNALFHPHMH